MTATTNVTLFAAKADTLLPESILVKSGTALTLNLSDSTVTVLNSHSPKAGARIRRTVPVKMIIQNQNDNRPYSNHIFRH